MAVRRFQVMALLQASRAYILGLPLESARSWGLNKAIFYAAAKRGFVGSGAKRRGSTTKDTNSSKQESLEVEEKKYTLGDDVAFLDSKKGTKEKPIFTFGGEAQTDEKFKSQIESRFKGSSFADAWNESLEYVRSFDKETLLSGSRFFSEVYRPKRDEFSKKWTEMSNEES